MDVREHEFLIVFGKMKNEAMCNYCPCFRNFKTCLCILGDFKSCTE